MEDKKTAKLFVGNLTYKVTQEDLNGVFRAYGEIVDIKIIDKGRHVYAFVEFSNIGDAEEAFRELQGKEVRGSIIKIEYASGPRNKTPRGGERSSGGGGGGGDKDRQECYQCGSTRHFKRDCPELRRGSRSRSKDKFKSKKKKSHRRKSSSSSRGDSSSKDRRKKSRKHNRSGSASKSNS